MNVMTFSDLWKFDGAEDRMSWSCPDVITQNRGSFSEKNFEGAPLVAEIREAQVWYAVLMYSDSAAMISGWILKVLCRMLPRDCTNLNRVRM